MLNDYFTILHVFTGRLKQSHIRIATGRKLQSIMEGKQSDTECTHDMIFLLSYSSESLSFLPCRGQMM